MAQFSSDDLTISKGKAPVEPSNDSSNQSSVTPLRCFTGALISAPLAFALYALTLSISQTFAAKPLTSSSTMAIRISIMVRTLVMGMSALGTAIFAFTTL
ncbi:MAG: DUF3082 domain-containing protein, partial [Merismopedia sp. SIO2A8]|nr:DUF3082 domain-containing protein [Merismopedia sp. SIO2A8]